MSFNPTPHHSSSSSSVTSTSSNFRNHQFRIAAPMASYYADGQQQQQRGGQDEEDEAGKRSPQQHRKDGDGDDGPRSLIAAIDEVSQRRWKPTSPMRATTKAEGERKVGDVVAEGTSKFNIHARPPRVATAALDLEGSVEDDHGSKHHHKKAKKKKAKKDKDKERDREKKKLKKKNKKMSSQRSLGDEVAMDSLSEGIQLKDKHRRLPQQLQQQLKQARLSAFKRESEAEVATPDDDLKIMEPPDTVLVLSNNSSCPFDPVNSEQGSDKTVEEPKHQPEHSLHPELKTAVEAAAGDEEVEVVVEEGDNDDEDNSTLPSRYMSTPDSGKIVIVTTATTTATTEQEDQHEKDRKMALEARDDDEVITTYSIFSRNVAGKREDTMKGAEEKKPPAENARVVTSPQGFFSAASCFSGDYQQGLVQDGETTYHESLRRLMNRSADAGAPASSQHGAMSNDSEGAGGKLKQLGAVRVTTGAGSNPFESSVVYIPEGRRRKEVDLLANSRDRNQKTAGRCNPDVDDEDVFKSDSSSGNKVRTTKAQLTGLVQHVRKPYLDAVIAWKGRPTGEGTGSESSVAHSDCNVEQQATHGLFLQSSLSTMSATTTGIGTRGCATTQESGSALPATGSAVATKKSGLQFLLDVAKDGQSLLDEDPHLLYVRAQSAHDLKDDRRAGTDSSGSLPPPPEDGNDPSARTWTVSSGLQPPSGKHEEETGSSKFFPRALGQAYEGTKSAPEDTYDAVEEKKDDIVDSYPLQRKPSNVLSEIKRLQKRLQQNQGVRESNDSKSNDKVKDSSVRALSFSFNRLADDVVSRIRPWNVHVGTGRGQDSAEQQQEKLEKKGTANVTGAEKQESVSLDEEQQSVHVDESASVPNLVVGRIKQIQQALKLEDETVDTQNKRSGERHEKQRNGAQSDSVNASDKMTGSPPGLNSDEGKRKIAPPTKSVGGDNDQSKRKPAKPGSPLLETASSSDKTTGYVKATGLCNDDGKRKPEKPGSPPVSERWQAPSSPRLKALGGKPVKLVSPPTEKGNTSDRMTGYAKAPCLHGEEGKGKAEPPVWRVPLLSPRTMSLGIDNAEIKRKPAKPGSPPLEDRRHAQPETQRRLEQPQAQETKTDQISSVVVARHDSEVQSRALRLQREVPLVEGKPGPQGGAEQQKYGVSQPNAGRFKQLQQAYKTKDGSPAHGVGNQQQTTPENACRHRMRPEMATPAESARNGKASDSTPRYNLRGTENAGKPASEEKQPVATARKSSEGRELLSTSWLTGGCRPLSPKRAVKSDVATLANFRGKRLEAENEKPRASGEQRGVSSQTGVKGRIKQFQTRNETLVQSISNEKAQAARSRLGGEIGKKDAPSISLSSSIDDAHQTEVNMVSGLPTRVATHDCSEGESSTISTLNIVSDLDEGIPHDGSSGATLFGSMLLFVTLCCFRLVNTLLVQSYFDPDEYWQTLEPAYCEAFSDNKEKCPGYTWEWTRRAPDNEDDILRRSMLGPARSYLSIVPSYLFYVLVRDLGIDFYWIVSKGPMLVSAIVVAAPIDMAVWYAGRWLLPPNGGTSNMVLPAWCLFCSLSSWFNGYTLVRTFANCQETLLLILSVALVGPELIGNSDERFKYLRACLAFFLGGVSVSIRFTSLAAFVPLGLVLAFREQSTLFRLLYLTVPCGLFGLIGIIAAMAVDKVFYGFWTIPFLANFHFNVILDNGALYGTHPSHWYLTSALPAVVGLLLPFIIVDFLVFIRGFFSKGECTNMAQRNLWCIVLSYITVLSFNVHKEFRFILPVLPLLCLLTGSRVRVVLRYRVLATMFVIVNVIALIYLGTFHQRGPVEVNRRILGDVSKRGARHIASESAATKPEATTYSIHYLTGECHSTPVHSQLHSQFYKFETWSLDCSPSCRADPSVLCESDRFGRDPVSFIQEAYAVFSSDVVGACYGDESSQGESREAEGKSNRRRLSDTQSSGQRDGEGQRQEVSLHERGKNASSSKESPDYVIIPGTYVKSTTTAGDASAEDSAGLQKPEEHGGHVDESKSTTSTGKLEKRTMDEGVCRRLSKSRSTNKRSGGRGMRERELQRTLRSGEGISSSELLRESPDYVVTYSSYVERIQKQLEMMNLVEIGRFPHHVGGLNVTYVGGAKKNIDDDGNKDSPFFGIDEIVIDEVINEEHYTNPFHRHVVLMNDVLEVSIEDVVLFARKY